jgi:polysaccharide biosynthesis/export protein
MSPDLAGGFLLAAALAGAAQSPPAAGPAPLANAYRIGRGDVLSIAVLGQEGLGGEFPVEADGMVAFPFVGRIKAEQASTAELERKLAALLADGYLKRPQVAVTVKQYRSQRVFVSGEVQNPGAYGLRPDRSLISLLREVGPLTANVGHEVVVIRPPAAAAGPPADESPSPAPTASYPGAVPGAEIIHASLRDLRSGYPDRDVQLRPGDTVYLPKAAQVYVTGHVARPGPYRYEEGLTVFQLLALAGGATERGAEKRARLARLQNGRRIDVRARPADVVLPEDTLHVPERFF